MKHLYKALGAIIIMGQVSFFQLQSKPSDDEITEFFQLIDSNKSDQDVFEWLGNKTSDNQERAEFTNAIDPRKKRSVLIALIENNRNNLAESYLNQLFFTDVLNYQARHLNENTAAHLAILKENPDKDLIQSMAKYAVFRPNMQNDDGDTPLHLALKKNNINLDIVKILIDNAANPSLKNKNDETPISLAIKSKNSPALELLLTSKLKLLNQQNVEGKTPLILAMESKNIPAIELLIKNGANPNLEGSNNETPLSFALKSKNLEALEVLLKNGAKPNQPFGKDNKTPFIFALESKYRDAVELIARTVPDVLTQGTFLQDQIFRSQNQDAYPLELLINLSTTQQLNKSSGGITALYRAVQKNYPKIVKMLLDKGADPRIIPGKETLLEIATREKKDPSIIQMLNEAEEKMKTPIEKLVTAIQTNNIPGIEALLQNNPGLINQKYGNLGVPLNVALKGNNDDTIKTILVYTTDKEVINGALLFAANNGKIAIVDALIKKGAKITADQLQDIKNSGLANKDQIVPILEGSFTPEEILFIAIRDQNTTGQQIEAMLKKNPELIKATNPNGKEPLIFAVDYGNDDVIKTVLNYTTDKDVLNRALIEAATRQYSLELLKELIKKGAMPSQELIDEISKNRDLMLSRGPKILEILQKAPKKPATAHGQPAKQQPAPAQGGNLVTALSKFTQQLRMLQVKLKK